MAVNSTPTILVVGSDSQLRAELTAALRGLANVNAVTHYTTDYRQGVETARSRRPDLALVQMDRDLRALKGFAEEVAVGAPETVVAAVFHPSMFGHDVSESSLMIEAIRAGIRDFLRRPLSSTDLEQLLDRLIRTVLPAPSRIGRIVSFVSNKGGVGKSTLAVNLACGLAKRQPRRVLLVDASLQMGVCATLLDLHPTTSVTDAVRQRQRLDETLIRQLATPHACGLDLLAAPANAIEAAEVDDEALARILTLARRTYDYVFVDSFPMLDRVMMAVLDVSDRVYLICEATVPTVLGMAHLIPLLDGLGLPRERQRLVLNRHSNFAGNLKAADVERRLGRVIDHVVPYQKKLLIAINSGKPYILQVGRTFSAFGRVVHGMIDDLEAMKPLPALPRDKGPTPSSNGTPTLEEETREPGIPRQSE